MSVSNFTVYIYWDVAVCDGLNNQRSARHMSREVSVAGNHKSPSETRMKTIACETTQKHQSQSVVATVTDNNAALLHMLSMTVRFVRCLCRGRLSLTWDKSLILSWIPPCFLTALKWQKCAWIHSVACGAPAGLLHRLPQSQKVPLSERKQTREVLSECRTVKGSAQEAGLTEGKISSKSCLFIWLITSRPQGKVTKHKEALGEDGIRKRQHHLKMTERTIFLKQRWAN